MKALMVLSLILFTSSLSLVGCGGGGSGQAVGPIGGVDPTYSSGGLPACSLYDFHSGYGYMDSRGQRIDCAYSDAHYSEYFLTHGDPNHCHYNPNTQGYTHRQSGQHLHYCSTYFDFSVVYPYHGIWGSGCTYWAGLHPQWHFFPLMVGGAWVCINSIYYIGPVFFVVSDFFPTGARCQRGAYLGPDCECRMFYDSMSGTVFCRANRR